MTEEIPSRLPFMLVAAFAVLVVATPLVVLTILGYVAMVRKELRKLREQNAKLLIELTNAVRGTAKTGQTVFLAKEAHKLPGA